MRKRLTNRDRDLFGIKAAKVLGVDRAIASAKRELEQRKALPK